MSVIDPDQMNAPTAALERLGLVQQHADPHLLQGWDHADRIVVAQHPVYRGNQVRAHPRHARDRGIDRPEGFSAIVAGEYAKVVCQAGEQLDQPLHGALVQIDVQVADLEQGKAVERRRQLWQQDVLVPDLNAFGVFPCPPIQAGQL